MHGIQGYGCSGWELDKTSLTLDTGKAFEEKGTWEVL